MKRAGALEGAFGLTGGNASATGVGNERHCLLTPRSTRLASLLAGDLADLLGLCMSARSTAEKVRDTLPSLGPCTCSVAPNTFMSNKFVHRLTLLVFYKKSMRATLVRRGGIMWNDDFDPAQLFRDACAFVREHRREFLEWCVVVLVLLVTALALSQLILLSMEVP